MEFELEDLEIDRLDSVSAPANPLSWALLAKSQEQVEKAQRLPAPDMSAQPFKPVTPAPMALVDLGDTLGKLQTLIASGRLASSNRRVREDAKVEFATIRALLSQGSGAHAMAEQAAAQRRNGLGDDPGTTTWNGTSIRVAPDGSRHKVTTTTKSAEPVTKQDMGALIRRRRGEAGLTQEQVAKATGVSERSLRSYEAGESVANAGNAFRIAKTLGLTLDEQDAWSALIRRERQG